EENPLQYLKESNVTLAPQRKLVRAAGLFRNAEYADDGVIISGTITNSATLARYKDIVFKVSFYSQTKTLIDENSYVRYEYYEPNSSKKFTLRVETPRAMENFDLE